MHKKLNRDRVYPYLIQSLHSSKSAEDFFRNHLDDKQLLHTLIDMSINDTSDDARMEAAYWVSKFPASLLKPFEKKLSRLAQEEWGSIAVHARKALAKTAELETLESTV